MAVRKHAAVAATQIASLAAQTNRDHVPFNLQTF